MEFGHFPAVDPLGSAAGIAQEIFQLAARKEADSADVVLALAQVLGITAAKLDQTAGFMPLEKRLQIFNDAVREVYSRRMGMVIR